jgi:uncharacterized membrane protein YfcA
MAALGSAIGGWVAKNLSPQICLATTSIMLCIGYVIMTLGRKRLAAADIPPTEAATTEAIGDTEDLTE